MTAAEVTRQEVFEDLELRVIEEAGEEWFSAEDIGKALGMEDPRKSINKLFNRNRDEFEGLYRVVNLTTWLKSGAKLPYRFTTFNPQGAYLLAILARTPKSKALRRWLAKFMAHDLDKLRNHVQALEAERHQQTLHLQNLQKKVQYWRKKAQSLEGQAPQRLPEPEPHQVAVPEPYPLPAWDDLVWVSALDLRDLVSLACQVSDKYEVPWFARVLAANGPTLDKNLQLILNALPALRKLLNFPAELPPPGISKLLKEAPQDLPN